MKNYKVIKNLTKEIYIKTILRNFLLLKFRFKITTKSFLYVEGVYIYYY